MITIQKSERYTILKAHGMQEYCSLYENSTENFELKYYSYNEDLFNLIFS